MLRLFHSADWHLGQSFHGFSREYEHGKFLSWLLGSLAEQRPDALLISGDIFDSVNPSAAAQRQFYNFLAAARQALPVLQIIFTAGNHDAAARLEAPSGLFESFGISAVGTISRDASGEIDYSKFLVPIRDHSGHVRAIAAAVPFLRPADVPIVEGAQDPYLDGIRHLYIQAADAAVALRESTHPGAVLVALGHCHMHGGTESRDSERRIVIGGAEALREDTFPELFSYVALGHLHRPQSLSEGRIHYSGSPIPLSFSEMHLRHQIVQIDIDETSTTVTSIPIPLTALLLRLPAGQAAKIEDVLALLAAHPFDSRLPPEAHPFLEIRVLDDRPDPTRRRRIEEALEGKAARLASIKLEAVPNTANGASTPATQASLADLATLDPEEIMLSTYRELYQTDPDAGLLAAFQEILAAEATAGEQKP